MLLCNTCNAPYITSYIETTDCRDFGGKPSEWRWGRVLLWKIPEFCSVGGARSQNSIFCVFRLPSTILCTAYRKQSYPKPRVSMESRDSEGVDFASLESVTRNLADIGSWRVRKSSRVKICIWTHVEKFTDSKKCYFFDLRWKITKLSQKNRFRTVASPGA